MLLLSCLLIVATCASTNTSLPSSPLTQSDKIDLLIHLNTLRSTTAKYSQPTASNMNFVFWDDALAIISQQAANKCDNKHPKYTDFLSYQSQYSQWQYPSIGYLISYRTSTQNTSKTILTTLLQDAYNENRNNWSYTKYNTSIPQYQHIMFDYLAWSELRYFGCGYQNCDTFSTFYCTLFYTESIYNNYPWTSGEPCTQCQADKTKCWNGLCGYCMTSDYFKKGDESSNLGDICVNLGIDYGEYTNSPTLEPGIIIGKDEDEAEDKSPDMNGNGDSGNGILLKVVVSLFVLMCMCGVCIVTFIKGKQCECVNNCVGNERGDGQEDDDDVMLRYGRNVYGNVDGMDDDGDNDTFGNLDYDYNKLDEEL